MFIIKVKIIYNKYMNIFIIFLLTINFTKTFTIFNKNHLKYYYEKNILEDQWKDFSYFDQIKSAQNNKQYIILDKYNTINSEKTCQNVNSLESGTTKEYMILSFNITLLKTSILNFIPMLKLHHIILLYDKKYNNIYTIDFSPINQTSPKTLVKLLFNKNVNAEIRVRLIKNIMLNDSNKIIEQWNNINKVDYITSQKITDKTYNNIYNSEIKDFIKFIINHYNKNGNFMNLYTNNCQTFSKFILYIQKDFHRTFPF